MPKIIAEETLHIELDGNHRPLERSLSLAHKIALSKFGIDEYGNSDRVDEWERSCCFIEVEFQKLLFSVGMGGGNTTVFYKITCQRVEDEE